MQFSSIGWLGQLVYKKIQFLHKKFHPLIIGIPSAIFSAAHKWNSSAVCSEPLKLDWSYFNVSFHVAKPPIMITHRFDVQIKLAEGCTAEHLFWRRLLSIRAARNRIKIWNHKVSRKLFSIDASKTLCLRCWPHQRPAHEKMCYMFTV